MDKSIIDRRLAQLQAEGVTFRTCVHVGINKPAKKLLEKFEAVVLAGGSEKSRDLAIPGRELKGIHFAMEFLPQQTRRVLGDEVPEEVSISAKDKHVVVIGGVHSSRCCFCGSA